MPRLNASETFESEAFETIVSEAPVSEIPEFRIEGSNSFECYVMWSYPSNSNIKYLETRNQIRYLQEFEIQTPQQPNPISIS